MNKLIIDAAISVHLQQALAEDTGSGDITCEYFIDPQSVHSFRIIAKEAGVVCGLPIAEALFLLADPDSSVTSICNDGDCIAAGTTVMRVEGKANACLTVERTALNYICHLSGIATMTRRFVDMIKHYPVVLLDTRKTIPGMRVLEKYAVRIGGATNHRMGLYDMVLLKDTHNACLGIDRFTHIAAQSARVKKEHPTMQIEIEVESYEEALKAASAGVDIIMLDNMSFDDMKKTIQSLKGRILLEVSGNVSLEHIASLAQLGIDRISVGSLIHSVKWMDYSMKGER